MRDTIVIFFEGLEPQEVRVKAGSDAFVRQWGDWCVVVMLNGWFVKFKAKLERWERVHEQA